MDLIQYYKDNELPRASWDNVRSIYKRLSLEFNVLTDPYKLEFNDVTKNYLDHLIVAIDEVDHCIDELPDRISRDSITHSLIEFLGNENLKWDHKDATASLLDKVANLKHIVHVKGIKEEFIEASKVIFLNTEVKRHTNNIDELIQFIKKEGVATAVLPLSILGLSSKDKFGEFFTKLCMIMGIIDLVFDAKQDFKEGIITIKPGLRLYFKLFSVLIKEGLDILFSFPKKIRFLTYCIKFIKELIKE